MNWADVPGLIIATPIAAIEVWYWRVSFKSRGTRIKRVEAWLGVLLLVFVVFRLFTTWGVIRF